MSQAPQKRIGLGTFKNVLLLGAAGLGGWWAYNHVIMPALGRAEKGGSANPGAKPPNLKGQLVQAGKMSIVMSSTCIKNKEDRFIYTPVIVTLEKIVQVIKSPVRGHFTGRMLCSGSMKMAEIYRA